MSKKNNMYCERYQKGFKDGVALGSWRPSEKQTSFIPIARSIFEPGVKVGIDPFPIDDHVGNLFLPGFMAGVAVSLILYAIFSHIHVVWVP